MMETRASYLVVGAFALLAVIGALIFVLWAARSDKGAVREYVSTFHQSVSGLSVGSSVLLNGVRVGQVSGIRISLSDPGSVRVNLTMSADTPVRENSKATLESQGLTGLLAVAITGGTADSPLLKETPDQPARIPSELSRLQTIMAGVPQVISNMNETLDRVNAMLSAENARAFTRLLDSLSEVTEALANRKAAMNESMNNIASASESFAAVSRKLDKLVGSTQKLVDSSFTNAADSVNRAAARLDELLKTLEPGLTRMSRESGDELQRLLVEARRLMSTLTRLAHKMESDPRRFMFGNPVPEFKAQ